MQGPASLTLRVFLPQLVATAGWFCGAPARKLSVLMPRARFRQWKCPWCK